jgi:hypothetical protein
MSFSATITRVAAPQARTLLDIFNATVAGRSIVMRERLPAHTRWHRAPVVAV